MLRQRIEQLKHEYTDQYVVVDGDRPELARFKGITGQVKTINMCGRALVRFDAENNAAWYDIALDYLKVVDKPEPKPATPAEVAAAGGAAMAEKPPAKGPEAAPEPVKQPKPSPLELARKEKEEREGKAEAGGPGAENGKGPETSEPAPLKRPPKKAEPAAEIEDRQRLSALELARMEKSDDN